MDDDNRISITVCGDGGCGKSSITLRLVRSQWTSDYDPTIEDSYSVTRTIDGHPYYLSLTDTAGQEEYRGLWAASNLRSDAFLLVYDITSARSLDNLSYFADLIAMEEETRQDAGGLQPVKIVAGNKCDLKELREVSARRGLEWARGREAGFMETSARECVNVEETFALIVRRVIASRKAHHALLAQKQQSSRGGVDGPTSPTSPIVGGGLFPRPKPTARPPTVPVDKEADLSDFAERPGAKVRKRGGWWARFRAKVCCCMR